eukprot:6358526-Pyramimonas_sp.AAC.1
MLLLPLLVLRLVPWKASWCHLGKHRSNDGGSSISAPSQEPSKSPFGAFLGLFGRVLELSWGSFKSLGGRVVGSRSAA